MQSKDISTYTYGYNLKSFKDITKNDIINMCELLNNCSIYQGICKFEPEPIAEGGIIFKFTDNGYNKNWYKSMRLRFKYSPCGKWDWITKNVMTDWKNDNSIILPKTHVIETHLKSFYNAPPFTIEELHIWEDCFNQIGFFRKGKFPSKKDLLKK